MKYVTPLVGSKVRISKHGFVQIRKSNIRNNDNATLPHNQLDLVYLQIRPELRGLDAGTIDFGVHNKCFQRLNSGRL